ncbi:piggyBac transposable element-derived protein 4-like [Mytilus trossulus]|uniref:piggyBac transposable element-derived protein 4-like n=1 Tax=Mytilus trossulus TaxID=6551 RepID=UPI00300536B0
MRVTVWRDKKNINLLSTNCFGEPDKVNRKQKDGTIKEVPCPLSVKHYNMFMNGVDHADQLRSTYNISRKSLKWWKYLFNFLVDISIVNAYLLMRESVNHQIVTKKNRPRQMTKLEFRMKLAHQMLGPFHRKGNSRSKTSTPTTCSQNIIRKEPKTGCAQCNVNLCIECFRPYHRKLFPQLFV